MTRRRIVRAGWAAAALLCGALALMAFAAPRSAPAQGPKSVPTGPSPLPDPALVARGRGLFVDGCSSCHGFAARGRRGVAPSLYGAGAAAADFYLSTGRMPLASPRDQPVRTQPAYKRSDIDALVAYVGTLGSGPGIPRPQPQRGSLRDGFDAFTSNCAGCHQVAARGGIITGAQVPDLQRSSARQIAEAVRVGPYLMPAFGTKQIDDRTLDSIVRYVRATRAPDDRGGWGIGHIGPIPEGMVAWLLAGVALLIVARLLGERTE